MNYGIMNTPGLVINGKVVFSGRVPSATEVKELISNKSINISSMKTLKFYSTLVIGYSGSYRAMLNRQKKKSKACCRLIR